MQINFKQLFFFLIIVLKIKNHTFLDISKQNFQYTTSANPINPVIYTLPTNSYYTYYTPSAQTSQSSSSVNIQGTVYPDHPVPYGTGYYYNPGVTFTVKADRKAGINNEAQQSYNINKMKFDNVVKEMKDLKTELFGNPDSDMQIYRKNRDGIYDSQWLMRAKKIAKILELEELLDYYEKNHNNVSSKQTKLDENTLSISSKNLRK